MTGGGASAAADSWAAAEAAIASSCPPPAKGSCEELRAALRLVRATDGERRLEVSERWLAGAGKCFLVDSDGELYAVVMTPEEHDAMLARAT